VLSIGALIRCANAVIAILIQTAFFEFFAVCICAAVFVGCFGIDADAIAHHIPLCAAVLILIGWRIVIAAGIGTTVGNEYCRGD
jgi:hypothetical protein